MHRFLKLLTLLSVILTILSVGNLIYGAYINPPDRGVTQRWALLSQFYILIFGLMSLTLGYIGRIIDRRQTRNLNKISFAGIMTGIIISLLVVALLIANRFFLT